MGDRTAGGQVAAEDLVRRKLLRIEGELGGRYFEREEVIRGLLLALVSRQHVLLFGPPGTTKSALLRDVCGRVQVRYFGKQLTRFSQPDEILGPQDLDSYLGGGYRRFTEGMLPTAQVAFIDETFEGSSAILHTLLSILGDRIYEEGGVEHEVPIEVVVGASNVLPGADSNLLNFYDRFLLRYKVDYLRRRESFEEMIALESVPEPPEAEKTTISFEELKAAQAAAARVGVAGVLGQMADLWEHLLAKRGIRNSDRRYRKAFSLVRASAYLAGRAEAAEEDLEVLKACFWQEEGQIGEVARAILEVAHPFKLEAEDRLDEAEEILGLVREAVRERDLIHERYDECRGDVDRRAELAGKLEEASGRATGQVQDALKKLKDASDDLLSLRSAAGEAGRSTGRIDEVLARVGEVNTEVLRCVGLGDRLAAW